jgi:hypothetical protein
MNNASAVRKDHSIQADPRAGKYLTFFLASEEYGVEILKVQEGSRLRKRGGCVRIQRSK